MRNTIAICAIALLSAACSESKTAADASKADPNKPAVIQAPPVVLHSDTAKPDTMPAYRARMEAAAGDLRAEHSILITAAMLNDRRMVGSMLAPNAVVRLSDTTISGRDAVVNGLVDFALRTSLRDMQRYSRAIHAAGTTYTDSGAYVLTSQRGIAKPREERGTYVSVWDRGDGSEARWQLLRDELTPDPPAKKR